MDISTFFNALWKDYIKMAPRAQTLHQVFQQRGETIVNDHVAFRTLNLSPIDLPTLESHLVGLGYERFAPYDFPEKKLHAWGYIPPEETLPRIFLSELKCQAFSPSVQHILQNLCDQIDPIIVRNQSIFWSGRLWKPISWRDYQTLLAESEYAAWVAALGLRPNHFTLSVNFLKHTQSLEEVLQVVREQNIPLNTSGGIIKGSPNVLLEQASTLADQMPIEFAGNEVHTIPTCYYEFARRYRHEAGELYSGFVAASADRIFESTHTQK